MPKSFQSKFGYTGKPKLSKFAKVDKIKQEAAKQAKYEELKEYDERQKQSELYIKPKVDKLKGKDREIWATDIDFPDKKEGLELYVKLGAPEFDKQNMLGILMSRYPNAQPTFEGKTFKTYRELAYALANDIDYPKRFEIYGQFAFDIIFALAKDAYEGKPQDKTKVLDMLILQGVDKQYEARTRLYPTTKDNVFTPKTEYMDIITPVAKRAKWQEAYLNAEIEDINKEIETLTITERKAESAKVKKGEDISKLTKPVIITKIKELDPSKKNLAAKKKAELLALLESLLK